MFCSLYLKQFLIFWQHPLRIDISNNAYFDYDTNYFTIDTSNNLTLKNYWKRDVSNNLYYNSSKVGIGLSLPTYPLEVAGNMNINAGDLYRSGVSLSSTLSNFLPTSGGTLTGTLTGTTISSTNITATNLAGSGSGITNLDYNNIATNKPTYSNPLLNTSNTISLQPI